jgi:hypothetical protein
MFAKGFASKDRVQSHDRVATLEEELRLCLNGHATGLRSWKPVLSHNDPIQGQSQVAGKVELVKGMTREQLIDEIYAVSQSLTAAHPTLPGKKPKYPGLGTITKNVKGLQTLYNLVTRTAKSSVMPADNFDWLNGVGAVMKIVTGRTESINSATAEVTKIVGVLKWLKGYEALRDEYSKFMTSSAVERDSASRKNERSATEAAHYVPWLTIIKTFDEEVVDVKDRFLIGINVLFAPRRLDFRFLRLAKLPRGTTGEALKSKSTLPVRPETNYVVEAGSKCFFVFDEYKTNDVFGRQVFEVSTELRTAIKAYVAAARIQDGELLLGQVRDDTKLLSESQMSKTMKDTLERYFHNGMTQRDLRSSYSTHIHNLPNQSETTLTALTARLAHSLSTSRMYYKKIDVA